MSLRTVLIVALALVCGVSAVLFMNSLRPQAAASTDVVPVVVAAVDIPRGSTITSDHIKVLDWPKDRLPAGALSKAEEACDRVVTSLLIKDEPVLDAKLAVRGAGRGMAALIPKGMRAFTMQTPTLSSGVAGFILPGNKVDVLLTVTDQGEDTSSGGARTTTLLQNVEILAVDQRVEAPADNKMNANEMRSVTLLVTPEQASKLNLGQNKGQLHLSLRNPEDDTASDTKPATLTDIGQFEKRREKPKEEPIVPAAASLPPPAAPAQPSVVRTLRGPHEGEVLINPPVRSSAAGTSIPGLDLSESMRRALESIKGK
jgi:pilus assembly protein CpaB